MRVLSATRINPDDWQLHNTFRVAIPPTSVFTAGKADLWISPPHGDYRHAVEFELPNRGTGSYDQPFAVHSDY